MCVYKTSTFFHINKYLLIYCEKIDKILRNFIIFVLMLCVLLWPSKRQKIHEYKLKNFYIKLNKSVKKLEIFKIKLKILLIDNNSLI